MSDDKRSDFDLTTPNIQLPNQGRRPPERPNTPDSSNLDRTMVNFNTPREAPRQTPPGLTPPPSRGNSFDLTAVNFQVPYDADADDDDEVAYRRAATPVAPPPPPQYQQQQYPPQQQQQYQQQQYHSGAYQPAVAPAQAAPQRRIPLWAWLTGGGLLGFMFLLVAAVGLYFFWPFNSTFTLKVLNAPNGSKVFVDDQPVGVSEESGAIIVQALRAGQMREVRVTHEGYVDWRTTVRGEGGEVKEMRVKLMPLAEPVKAADDQIAKDLDELGRARIYLNFDTDSDRIKDDSRPTLDKIVTALKKRPELRVMIEGHTDSMASAEHNKQLSERRALSVKNYLQTAGVEAARLSTVGLGAAKPVASNDTAVGRAVNRRVELVRQQ